MADLKKKFIDILFEDDIDEEELQEDSYFEKKNSSVKKDEQSINAKDILYRKSGTSAFIDLEDTTKKEEETSKDDEMYEMSSQISPIFGLLKENKRRQISVDREIVETQTNKPDDSHLDIITSPIYGYGNKEDAEDNDYDVKNILDENEEAELHHLFDESEEESKFYYSNQEDDDSEDISLFRLFGENK